MTLAVFFDENMSVRLAAMFRVYEPDYAVTWEQDRFGKGCEDTEWIPQLSGEDPRPIIITCDLKMLVNKEERKALAEGDFTLALLTKNFAQQDYRDQVWKFFRYWKEIGATVMGGSEPYVYKISENGKIKESFPTRSLLD